MRGAHALVWGLEKGRCDSNLWHCFSPFLLQQTSKVNEA